MANALKEYIDNATLESKRLPFKQWLIETKGYSARTASDAVSRVKRANALHQITDIPVAYYICDLDQVMENEKLSVNVKSQISRAMKLYASYLSGFKEGLMPIE